MDRQEIVTLFAQRHEALVRHDAVEASMCYAENSVLASAMAGGTIHGHAAVRHAEIASVAASDTGGFMELPRRICDHTHMLVQIGVLKATPA